MLAATNQMQGENKRQWKKVNENTYDISSIKSVTKTLFTWSGGPRSSGVSFFCFVSPRAWKQKKATPLDRGPPLHVNRPLRSFWKFHVVVVQNNGKEMYKKSVLLVKSCFFAN